MDHLHTPPPLSEKTEQRIARARIRWYRVVGICTLLTLGLVLGGVIVLIGNAETGRTQRQLLIDCTTAPALRDPPVLHPKPTDCYLRQQSSAAALVGQPSGPINTVAVAAAACGAAHPGDVAATRICVLRSLRR
jgi:hypothetical protein